MSLPFFNEMLKQGITALSHFLNLAVEQKQETIRIARVGSALLLAGCSARSTFPGKKVASYLTSTQQKDGGWHDTEETVWCLRYLDTFGYTFNRNMLYGRKWLKSIQLPCKAWGKDSRDMPRIPITALLAILLPDIVDNESLYWLSKQWESELDSPTQLTYKGAFFLLTQSHKDAPSKSDLVDRTISYLESEQEEDGGFAPWKGHPVGSDPWNTGVVLWGLSRVGKLAPRQTIERALSWLKSNQLPNGLWPYHYLDDGTAMALIGISSVLPIPTE
ncbi:prenyltransferase/squalene oxidase repeat-containing protein [Chloroflexota bacterium]